MRRVSLPIFRLKRLPVALWLIALCVLTCAQFFPSSVSGASTGPSFVEFESGHVRPIAMSPDGTTLFAVNTPNGALEVFNITPAGLTLQTRVPVGMEPVAVAARSNNEAWVVNHLSDSVSIVTLSGTPHVTRTLLVGDEPRDIVFAGNPSRAFITTAHRGQQRTDPSIANVPGAGDPQFTTPGVPRADVWVFDPANLGNTLGGTPLKIMSFFADTPRALAVSPDKNTIYVAGFKTGNQTSVVLEPLVCPGFQPNTPCVNSNLSTSPGGNPGQLG
jgi:DNA-binding beta-propeller fold protein YncE